MDRCRCDVYCIVALIVAPATGPGADTEIGPLPGATLALWEDGDVFSGTRLVSVHGGDETDHFVGEFW